MPIFEYQCRACGAKFEKISTSPDDRVLCQRCASPKIEKLLSVFAVTGGGRAAGFDEPGPCPCGAPRRGMCGE